MKAFTGIKDIDLKIIQQLSDKEIPIVCRANKYVSKLCNDETFWFNRLMDKSKLSLEDLKNIKGNLSYKKVYRYLYLGDYKKGVIEAIKDDNVYLYKAIPISKDGEFLYEIAMDAAGYNSIEILNYIFINSTDLEKQDLPIYIYSLASEKTIKWMDKMDLISYSDYIKEWIVVDVEVFENIVYPYQIIKKYITKVKNYDGFMKTLGASLHYGDLETRKKIFDLFIENNIDVENYKDAITTAERIVEDKNKLKEWIDYINIKMKK